MSKAQNLFAFERDALSTIIVTGSLTQTSTNRITCAELSGTKLQESGTEEVLLGSHFVKLGEPRIRDQLGPGKRVVLWLRLLNSLFC